MNINIPEKYRQEFDKAVLFAVERGAFTPKELASHLGASELTASIMIGYMEKALLVTGGKLNDERRALITLTEWVSIDGKIENYVPKEPEEKEQIPQQVLVDEPTLEPLFVKGACVSVSEGSFVFEKGADNKKIPVASLAGITVAKPRLFRRGRVVFSFEDGAQTEVIYFRKKEHKMVLSYVDELREAFSL